MSKQSAHEQFCLLLISTISVLTLSSTCTLSCSHTPTDMQGLFINDCCFNACSFGGGLLHIFENTLMLGKLREGGEGDDRG